MMLNDAQATAVLKTRLATMARFAEAANAAELDETRERVLGYAYKAVRRLTIADTIVLVEPSKKVIMMTATVVNGTKLVTIIGDNVHFWMNASSLDALRAKLAEVQKSTVHEILEMI